MRKTSCCRVAAAFRLVVLNTRASWLDNLWEELNMEVAFQAGRPLWGLLTRALSGFGGLVVSMPPSGTQVTEFEPGRSRLSHVADLRHVKKTPRFTWKSESQAKLTGHFLSNSFLHLQTSHTHTYIQTNINTCILMYDQKMNQMLPSVNTRVLPNGGSLFGGRLIGCQSNTKLCTN
jgi:hypothetical protein